MGLLRRLEQVARWTLARRGFRSRLVRTRIGEVHVYDAEGRGELPPIVVLHGIGSNAAPYLRVLTRLRAVSRRVLMPEAPGHGLSPLPDQAADPDTLFTGIVEALTASLDEPAWVFGNSLGGGMALRLAIDHPRRVRGLVLSSPAGAPFPAGELEPFLRGFELASRDEAIAFVAKLYHRTPWYAGLLASDLQAMFARPFMGSLLRAVRDEHFVTPEQLGALQLPMLLLWGADERLLPAAHLAYFRAHLPDHAVVEEPPRFAHSPYLEYPGVLAERIVDFVTKAEATPSQAVAQAEAS